MQMAVATDRSMEPNRKNPGWTIEYGRIGLPKS